MPSNYNMPDPVLGTKDLDDEFITDSWLVEQYVGNTIWGTGQNLNGSLFLGVGTSKSSMTLGLGLNYTSVVTGNYYGMAIRNDGTLWACGYNLQGQLGIGTSVSVSSPVQVGTLTNWKQVSCSYGDVTMMVKTDGTLWGCGYSTEGQLGNGVALSQYSSPIQIGSLTNWKQVATSDATLAIKTDGTLWACGYGAQGQLGLGNTVSYLSPVQVGSLTNWKQVYTGVSFVAAIKTDGTLWAWGSNSIGQLGLGNLVNYSSPVQVGSLTNWRSLSIPAAGTNAMAAIKTDGTLWVWGLNNKGQLGLGNTVAYSSPVQVGSLTNWKQIAIGISHMAAVKTDGTLWAWGSNNGGQLGTGNTTYYSSPIQVGSLTNWKQVSCGKYITLATTYAG